MPTVGWQGLLFQRLRLFFDLSVVADRGISTPVGLVPNRAIAFSFKGFFSNSVYFRASTSFNFGAARLITDDEPLAC